MKRLLFIFSIFLSLTALGQGGGVYLLEVGNSGIGNANAGAPAVALDASVAYTNPAALTELESNQLFFGAGIMPLIIDVTITDPLNNGNTTDDASGNGVMPTVGMYWAHKINDKFSVGATINNVAGSSLNYEDDWIGRYILTEGLLAVLNVAPAVAYRLNDQWSFGASLNIYYSLLDVKLRIPSVQGGAVVQDPATDSRVEVKGHDMALGFRAGVHFRPSEYTRFGLVYRLGNTYDYDSDLELFNSVGDQELIKVPLSAEVGIVSGLEFGFAQRIGKWDILADVGWSNWNEYVETPINIQLEGQVLPGDEVSAALPRDWKDTWRIGVGANYYLDDKWTFQAGFSYDSSVVNDQSQVLDLPGFAVYRYGLGAKRIISDRVDLGIHWNLANGVEGGEFTHESGLGDVTGHYDKFFLHTAIIGLTWLY